MTEGGHGKNPPQITCHQFSECFLSVIGVSVIIFRPIIKHIFLNLGPENMVTE
jgi:hypothetical protein